MEYVIKNFNNFALELNDAEFETSIYSELCKLSTLFEIISKIHNLDEKYRICVEKFIKSTVIRLRKNGLVVETIWSDICDANALALGIHKMLYFYSTLEDKSVEFKDLELSCIIEKYGRDCYQQHSKFMKEIQYKSKVEYGEIQSK